MQSQLNFYWKCFLAKEQRQKEGQSKGDQVRAQETHTLVPSKHQQLAIDYSTVALALLL